MPDTTRPLAIVAAVGPGLGLAVARRFARQGFAVAMIARNAEALAGHVATIAADGGTARGYPADLCDLAGLAATFDAIARDFGPTEVLVYNGGRWHAQPVITLDPMTFNWDLALCATGALACAQAVHPAMKAAGRGTIIFTGGGLALHPQYGVGTASLSAGKAALRNLTFAMAGELAPDGIHVATVTVAGTIAPGAGPLDPDRIADHYWDLHIQPRADWQTEHVVAAA